MLNHSVIYFCLPETRDTILLMRKAKQLRKETGNERIYAEYELERSGPGHLYKVSLIRPFKFLRRRLLSFEPPRTDGLLPVTEPITYSAALINGCKCQSCRRVVMADVSFAVTYGLIFLSNEAFPLVFVSDERAASTFAEIYRSGHRALGTADTAGSTAASSTSLSALTSSVR